MRVKSLLQFEMQRSCVAWISDLSKLRSIVASTVLVLLVSTSATSAWCEVSCLPFGGHGEHTPASTEREDLPSQANHTHNHAIHAEEPSSTGPSSAADQEASASVERQNSPTILNRGSSATGLSSDLRKSCEQPMDNALAVESFLKSACGLIATPATAVAQLELASSLQFTIVEHRSFLERSPQSTTLRI